MRHILTHCIVMNPSYPTLKNGRGSIIVPEASSGAATLPLLAAIVHSVRPDCEIRIYDEIGTSVDMDYIDGLPRESTLMLLTTRTNLAYEAKQWALRLQVMGFAVVLGGPHVSACLEEVRDYANAAVHGEAEIHLPHVIEDFENGNFDSKTLPGIPYQVDYNFDMAQSILPERHLYKASDHWMSQGVIEFSRGCPNRCSFCASNNLFTHKMSYKQVPLVLQEIEQLPKVGLGYRVWFFSDDNFAAVPKKTIELCHAIKARFPKVLWGGAITVKALENKELMEAMIQAGMRAAFVGFDSLNNENLQEANKSLAKAEYYANLIDQTQKMGALVIAGLVLGFDHDKKTVFEDTLKWSHESNINIINLNILRPYPTTPTYSQLLSENRLIHEKWWMVPFERRLELVQNLTGNVSGAMTVYQPKHMSPSELTEGTLWLGQEFYKLSQSIPRLWRNRVRGSLPTLLMDAVITRFYGMEYQSWRPPINPARSP